MTRPQTVIFLGDGMADEPIAALDGKTPLEAASTPGMDSIARAGVAGTLLTLPDEFPTGSEVANMSVLGCDLATEYCGRGPLEAAGRRLALSPDDIAFRVNLTTVENGILTDFSGGHVEQADAELLVAALNEHFGGPTIRFRCGVSYRNLLVLSGASFAPDVSAEKPDDNRGEPISEHLPTAATPAAEATADLFRRIMLEAGPALEANPVNQRLKRQGRPMANGAWPWSGGRMGSIRTLKEKYAISSAVISAVDVIIGLGRCLGMDVIDVPGATGYIDTNYRGKAEGAIRALRDHDLVYVHLEAIDEVSHGCDLDMKLEAIERFDSDIVVPVLQAFGQDLNVAVLPDHPVPIATGKHTRDPVPVAVRMAGTAPDNVTVFGESACRQGSLGALQGGDLMSLLFA